MTTRIHNACSTVRAHAVAAWVQGSHEGSMSALLSTSPSVSSNSTLIVTGAVDLKGSLPVEALENIDFYRDTRTGNDGARLLVQRAVEDFGKA
jgi:hypothetical protein